MRALVPLALLLAAPVVAQTGPTEATPDAAGRIETARALVDKMNIDRLLDFQFASLMPLVTGNVLGVMQTSSDAPAGIKQVLATPEGQAKVRAIVSEEMLAAMRSRYPEIREAAAEEYRRSFSEEDLKAIVAFYNTQAGQHLLALQPQLQQRLAEFGKGMGRDAGMAAFPKIRARIEALAKTQAPAATKQDKK
ncbi:DUF2059 domain-containing protein [Sphingomonas sp. gentR]|jgi:hypothetical protein|uniref:DUF2059 domain-containing protein n=1 Tax=unclassified Sphingomonas TaxID=196159 RepID=UPI0012EC8229|nr:DUF2059 domain-containing protein [Sphingomonas sp. LK11]